MKKIKYQLYLKNSYYFLKDLNTNSIIHYTITFYSMYCFLKEKNYDFKSISLPRLTLYKFFRYFVSFALEESI